VGVFVTKQLSIVIAVLGFLLVTVSACDDGVSNGTDDGVSNGTDAYYAKKLELLRQAANQGEAFAQSNLGAMYKDGQGVSQDYAEAAKWYRLAAEQGYAAAQTNLGFMYDNGQGVIQNNVIAHMLYNLAGAQGSKNGGKNRDSIAERMTPNDISRAQEMAATCLEKNYRGCGF
jgi:uncharacterized protein